MLFTVLGLFAYFQRGRNQDSNTLSESQDENVDQNDDVPVPHVEINEGQTSSQDIVDDFEVFSTEEEPITGDPEVDDDWSDDFIKDMVGDLSEWSADVLRALNGVLSKYNVDTVEPQSSQQEDNDRDIMDINSCHYKIGAQLGYGGFGSVYAATRLEDNVQVAVKFASSEHIKFVSIDGYPDPVPIEVALHALASLEPRVNEILELLDWQKESDHYIMVIERPMPCQSLYEFSQIYRIAEDMAQNIMRQAIFAAQICVQRDVFHRDIKPENFLINPHTLRVKLIDFGCGEYVNRKGYRSFAGTLDYCPPEFKLHKKYHAEPATVWSLGILMFEILFVKLPSRQNLDKMNNNTWSKDGLSQECCDFMSRCLQIEPEKRIGLDEVHLHDWFKLEKRYHPARPLE